MTLIWFVAWLVADQLIGGREPLVFDPVNLWAGLLLGAIALDLSAAVAQSGRGRS